jgi:23S rRNA (uridine2552-2'-O)-methyltransferase
VLFEQILQSVIILEFSVGAGATACCRRAARACAGNFASARRLNVAKNKFNHSWLHDHINDPYVKLAQKHGYRARAAFKLKEIDERDHLIKPGMTVVDLGSAPGSWSQYLRERMRNAGGKFEGRIVALDMLPMEPVADVIFIVGDFREEETLVRLREVLNIKAGERVVDLVLSDMAPNLSGVEVADAARIQHVVELAQEFAQLHLKPQGALLVKAFQGSGYSQLVEGFKHQFRTVAPRKPKASRDRSAETFLLGRTLKEVTP